ncbi:hypothetical protein QWJ26_13290 [Streptomyces sp. CSDS2]|uniref:hypothetical protein n=1 Tax=Streptomyces sp. CSDS2 TaxID=3055051 RepID=UPI0025AF2E17|nr:hypothetical protein [Streptomyces sp. CSDS2]MDN3260772.1 hypothetical protein [Streptomyces sp. CSDS2]
MSNDLPQPLVTCWLSWVAIPTGDQAGVMAALGLARPVPVTFAEAEAVVEEAGHAGAEDDPGGCARVYVSPELDGWTLVIGPWCDSSDRERSGDVLRLCIELSSRYGAAQAYFFGAQGDGSAWLVAEKGAVVRRYCETGEAGDASLTLGHPLEREQVERERMGLPPVWDESLRNGAAEEEWKWRAFDMAPEIAAALGISPLALTARTRVRGSGVLADTPAADCPLPVVQ